MTKQESHDFRRGSVNIRTLVKPGITYIDFGPADLMFDIETKDHPFLKSIDDCREFMQKELEGVNVRFFS